MKKQTPHTQDEARQYAIDWQDWQREQSMSYADLADWQNHFAQIAKQFDLEEEFKINGII